MGLKKLLICLLIFSGLFAQMPSSNAGVSGNIRLFAMGSFNSGNNGAYIYYARNVHIKNSFFGQLRFETGINGLGFYGGSEASIHYLWKLSKKWHLDAGISIFQGMEFFRPVPLYLWGSGLHADVYRKLTDRLEIGIHFSPRIYSCPAYKKYGRINTFIDFPVGLIVGF